MKGRRIKDLEKYSDQWVALDSNKTMVVVGGKTLKEVIRKAAKKVHKPVFLRVPRLDVGFAP